MQASEGTEKAASFDIAGAFVDEANFDAEKDKDGGKGANEARRVASLVRRLAKAMRTCIDEGGLMLAGRALNVIRAVNKDKAERMRERDQGLRLGGAGARKEKIDRRHLYLAREGTILPNPAITNPRKQPCPPKDMAKRQRGEGTVTVLFLSCGLHLFSSFSLNQCNSYR